MKNAAFKGGCTADRKRLFSGVPSDRNKGNGHKMKHRRFSLNIREHFFTVRVTEYWDRLPGEVAGSPSLQTPKINLNIVLDNLLYMVQPEEGCWVR